MQVRAHMIVSGMVQGIGYRYFVQRTARRLGLVGWVRNLWSGEVEIEVEGERGLIEALIKELRTGHPYATIRNITLQWEDYTGEYKEFSITF